MKYGKLEVIEIKKEKENNNKMCSYAYCVCNCGNKVRTRLSSLKNGHTKSCGCLQKEKASSLNRTHGKSNTRLHRIWGKMKNRCNNPKNSHYHCYGGRGITVCDEWRDSFESFYEWAIKGGYKDSLSIDRKNVNGNYEPANCRWATPAQQARNQRRSIKYKGETASEASRRLGGFNNMVAMRIRVYGWSKKKAFTTPVDKNQQRNFKKW